MNQLALKQTAMMTMVAKADAFMAKHKNKVNWVLMAALAAVLFIGLAAASTDTTFATWNTWLVEKIEGTGGKFLTFLALIAAVWSMLNGSMKTLGIMIVIVLFTTQGPTVLNAMFTYAF